jgi:predicted dehydrogenase
MKKLELTSGISRRRFLAATGFALAAPSLIPSSALGADGSTAPSERVTLGVVGWGMQGPGNTDAFLGIKECQVVAACDLDKNHLQAAVSKINERNGNEDCKSYHDYRELMARKDIDAVMLAVPDNWHALVATEAARNNKDIYGEKPLARTIAEQQAIVKAVQKNKRIWQTGSWQRSQAPFRKAAEIVRNGLIGKVTRVEVGLPAGHHDFAGTGKFMTPSEPPPELDYETWLVPRQWSRTSRGVSI